MFSDRSEALLPDICSRALACIQVCVDTVVVSSVALDRPVRRHMSNLASYVACGTSEAKVWQISVDLAGDTPTHGLIN